MKNIIKEVAKANGTTEQEVKNEMRIAIKAAMQSKEPSAQAFWKQIAPDGKEPPVEKVIASIALPEGMEDAVQTVMTQCELWTDNVMEI